MGLEILNRKNCNHVVILKFFKGLNLTRTSAHRNDAAIVQPGIAFNGLKNFIAPDFL